MSRISVSRPATGGGGGSVDTTDLENRILALEQQANFPLPYLFQVPNGTQTVWVYTYTLSGPIAPGDQVQVSPSFGPDVDLQRTVSVWIGRDDFAADIPPAGMSTTLGDMQITAGADLDGNFSLAIANVGADFPLFAAGETVVLRAISNNDGSWA